MLELGFGEAAAKVLRTHLHLRANASARDSVLQRLARAKGRLTLRSRTLAAADGTSGPVLSLAANRTLLRPDFSPHE